jgi:hypothetical protein
MFMFEELVSQESITGEIYLHIWVFEKNFEVMSFKRKSEHRNQYKSLNLV